MQIVRAKAGSDLESTPRSWSFCDHTIRCDDMLVVKDARLDSRFKHNPLVVGQPFIRFYAGAQILYVDGIQLGAVCLIDPKPWAFAAGDTAEFQLFADEVTSLIMQNEYQTILHRNRT